LHLGTGTVAFGWTVPAGPAAASFSVTMQVALAVDPALSVPL